MEEMFSMMSVLRCYKQDQLAYAHASDYAAVVAWNN
jgi:hypothetical protein